MRSIWILTAVLVLTACAEGPTRRTYTNETPDANTTKPLPTPNNPNSLSNSVGSKPSEGLKHAQSLYAKGDYPSALAALSNYTSNHGAESAEYFNLKGLAELGNKMPSEAQASFEKALQKNGRPEYAGYYQYNLATAFFANGKKDEAARTLGLIETSKMDLTDQKKIEVLKTKLGTNSALGSATPTPNSAVATPTPMKETYSGGVLHSNRVGLLLPLSGKYESFGKKVQHALELAFQNSPRSHAKEIELVPMDSGDSPITQQEALKKLIEEQGVVAVIGPLLSKGIDILAERAEYYQVPLISIAQVQGAASPNLFSCSISSQDQAARIADYAMKLRGFHRFAILAPSNKAGEEIAHNFWDEILARGGEVRAFELYDPDLTDFRVPVDKALGLHYPEARAKEVQELAEKRKELNITKKTMKTQQYFALPPIIDFDAVFIADEAKTVGQIIPTFAYRDARNLAYLGITSWNSSQLISRAQDQAEGASFPVVFNTLSPPPETKKFYDLYTTTFSTTPGELDALAYDSANLVIDVMDSRPNTRQEFKEKMEKVSNVSGATGKVSVKDHHCVRDLTLYTVKKGEFQVVRDEEK